MSKANKVIAIGFFDGVHLGHGALLKAVKEISTKRSLIPWVISFDTHPSNYVKSTPVPLICDALARADIIKRLYDIDNVSFLHFDTKLMKTTWESFADSVIDELGAAHLVVGHDFRFGYKGTGTAEILKEYCLGRGIGCEIISPVIKDGVTVSSTYIRPLIASGNMEQANKFLGHPHVLLATVEHGNKLGRTIETPTINMHFSENVIVPRHGVYATKVILDNIEYPAVTNIGVRPTVTGADTVSVESFILDFDGNLYDQQVRVEFYTFIRPEVKFHSLGDLKLQIKKDAMIAREFLMSNAHG